MKEVKEQFKAQRRQRVQTAIEHLLAFGVTKVALGRYAGVSHQAISSAYEGRGTLSEETYKKILALLSEKVVDMERENELLSRAKKALDGGLE